MDYQFIIAGEIGVAYDWWTGQKGTTTEEVHDFLQKHRDEEVHIAVSSPGGYVDAGLEIYQLIRDHGKVHMHILGMTASAATFLTMGAASVDMVDGSLMLIHNASTAVMEWQSANKQELDQIIEKYKKEREDLDTIDKVIASLYAKKSGKTVEECMKKMDRAAWLSPQDALDFGLIDAIRDDENEGKKAKNIRNHFVNNYSKEFGLPPVPTDDQANPTKSLLGKTAEMMKSLFRNQSASNSYQSQMKKIFLNVMALLAITDGFQLNDDESLTLTKEQMKTIDDALGTHATNLENETKAKNEIQAKLDKALEDLKKVSDDLKKANETIENLKKVPGDKTSQVTDNEVVDDEDFLKSAGEAYNRIKEL